MLTFIVNIQLFSFKSSFDCWSWWSLRYRVTGYKLRLVLIKNFLIDLPPKINFDKLIILNSFSIQSQNQESCRIQLLLVS